MAKYSSDKRPAATPKTKKAWDQPSPPTKGDEKQETTFVAVGRALTAWEEFESAFAHLFSEVIGVSGDNLPAIRAYGAVLTFRGRAEMMEAAAEAYFFEHPQEKLQRDMKNLLTAAKGFAARRNEIAHGIVRNRMVPSHVIMNRQGGMLQMSKARGWAVEPSDYMTGKTDLAAGETLLSHIQRMPKYVYASREIILIMKGFLTIRADAVNLSYKINGWIQNVVHRSSPRK